MKLRHVYQIARREFLDILSNKSTVIAGLLFTSWFSVYHGFALGQTEAAKVQGSYEASILAMTAMVAVFVGYIYSGQAFLFEKTEGIIETLMSTPIRLRSLWVGKALGIALPAWICSLIFGVAFTFLGRHYAGVALAPDLPMILHLLVVVPLFTVAAVGMIGLWQLVLGMRENQVVNLLCFLVLFFAIFFSRTILEQGIATSWQAAVSLFVMALGFGGFTVFLSRFLSKERIVRTIP
ncbi:MAG: ABC transporter permease [Armatimonadota bacterium]